MFLRALVAFLACPGMAALVIPAWISWNRVPAETPWFPIGVSILTVGFAMLLWCVRDFYVAGKGTLAPWAPPRNLVVVGLYRYSRNPMYVAVTLMLTIQDPSYGAALDSGRVKPLPEITRVACP